MYCDFRDHDLSVAVRKARTGRWVIIIEEYREERQNCWHGDKRLIERYGEYKNTSRCFDIVLLGNAQAVAKVYVSF